MNHIEPVEMQIGQGDAHGARHLGRDGVLDLEAEPLGAPDDQQVELGSLVCSPEETLAAIGAEV